MSRTSIGKLYFLRQRTQHRGQTLLSGRLARIIHECESDAEPSPSVTAVIGSEETATRASNGFNGAPTARNDRTGVCSKTRPSLPVDCRENMSRLTALRRRAREHAITDDAKPCEKEPASWSE